MTTEELPETEPIVAPRDPSNLRVSVIYEDVASGLRAKDCLTRIARSLDLEKDFFSLRLWSFDLLSDPGVRAAAAREARDFDIIFVSTHNCNEPPTTVKTWMQEWLQCRSGQPCALAVLLDKPAQAMADEAPLRTYFTDVAKKGGLDLLCPYVESVAPPSDDAIRKIARSAINASPVLEDILDQWESHNHWGINE